MSTVIFFIGTIAGIVAAMSAATSTTPGMIVLLPVGVFLATFNFLSMIKSLIEG